MKKVHHNPAAGLARPDHLWRVGVGSAGDPTYDTLVAPIRVHPSLQEILTLLGRERRLLVLPAHWLHMTLAGSALPHRWEQREAALSFYVEFTTVEASGYSLRLVPDTQRDLARLCDAFGVAEPEHATCILTLAYAREPIEPATVARLLDAAHAVLAAQIPRVLVDRLEHRRSHPGEPFSHTLVRVWDLLVESHDNEMTLAGY